MFVRVRLTLRTRLALMYGALVALTTALFALVAYFTVSNELYQNLDASLSRAGTSLLAVIRNQQRTAQGPLKPVRRDKRSPKTTDAFEFLRRSSMRNFVGPVPLPDSLIDAQDPVWSAVYEHVLLNSSTYVLQVRNRQGGVAWRSDNMLLDSLPSYQWFLDHGAIAAGDRIITYYTMRGIRYRLVVTIGDVAEVAAAYPAAEVDVTLRSLFSLMLLAIPILIVVSVVAGWFLARRSLRPVDTITTAARRITAERLSERLPLSDASDEIARLSETLNDMIARLERQFQQIRQFTADASHELKTPLAILMGEMEIALRKPFNEEEIRETLESCLEEVDRLTNVVQGLLELSRAESGQVQIEREPLNFSALVHSIYEDVEILAETKHLAMSCKIEPNIFVIGDKVRLHQACLNVMENAVKYTPSTGSVQITIESMPPAHDDDKARVMFTVADSGIGIPHEQLPFIYDRFFRVDKARSKSIQGTGLGLSIVRWIVEAHNGTIMAASEESVGTTFVITLPRA